MKIDTAIARAPAIDRSREAARMRVRQWHEQRTAAGRCHRCPRMTEDFAWLCRKCRLELSEHRRQKRLSMIFPLHAGPAPAPVNSNA
jgi:hypothetical protein